MLNRDAEAQNSRVKKRILVMDDEELVRLFAENMLDKLGYDVVTVRDGEAAIRRYKDAKETGTPFAAVIMDLSVSDGLGGKETITELLAYDPEVTAIISSGYLNDPVMSDFREYGFKARIAKPFDINELVEVLGKSVQ